MNDAYEAPETMPKPKFNWFNYILGVGTGILLTSAFTIISHVQVATTRYCELYNIHALKVAEVADVYIKAANSSLRNADSETSLMLLSAIERENKYMVALLDFQKHTCDLPQGTVLRLEELIESTDNINNACSSEE
ncbi:MAG TPA: hypothetical protein VJI68_02760 [Candidatus Nanoarchaeia archaeon]|nr:hypothetical protein [Candidatus Nanoarchaeia archaeon]